MNRSTYALKSHLSTLPVGTDGDQQRFPQTAGGIRQRAHLPKWLLAASHFKGAEALPVMFAQAHTRMHTQLPKWKSMSLEMCETLHERLGGQSSRSRANLLAVMAAHLTTYSSKTYALSVTANARWNRPVNLPPANRDWTYQRQKAHGLGTDQLD